MKSGKAKPKDKEQLLHLFKAFRHQTRLSREEANAKRAYLQFKRFHNIDIPKQAAENFRHLLNRLKKLDGNFPDDLKAHLRKNLGKNQALTFQEKKILKTLLSRSWVLRHVTSKQNYLRIVKSNATLLSLTERRKLKYSLDNANTNFFEGNSDNIFFTFGPGEPPTARFLDDADIIIQGNLAEIFNSDNPALRGAWSSGHVFAFLTEQKGEKYKIMGTEYSVVYKYGEDKHKQHAYLKYCTYKYPDGRIAQQILGVQHEIFTHPKLDISVALMTIEKMRYLGLAAYEKMMSASPEELEKIVQIFFHSGTFEVHKPVTFNLHQPGVQVLERSPIQIIHYAKPIEDALLRPLMEKIFFEHTQKPEKGIKLNLSAEGFQKSIDETANFGHTSFPIDKIIKMDKNYLNLLSAAIITKNLCLIELFLKKGANPSVKSVIYLNGRHTAVSSFFLAILLGHSEVEKELHLSFPAKELNRMETMVKILKIFHEHYESQTRQDKIFEMISVDKDEAMLATEIFKDNATLMNYTMNFYYNFDPPLLSIFIAVLMQSVELTQKLISMGANINRYTIADAEALCGFDFTPLLLAVFLNDQRMVEFLIKQKCDLNLPAGNAKKVFPSHLDMACEETGYTPLMLAVKLGYESSADILIEAGADLNARSRTGQTVFSLAKTYQRDKVLLKLKQKLACQLDTEFHQAARKNDFERCQKLFQSQAKDLGQTKRNLMLNSLGESVYDLLPKLFEKPYIPLERQLENFKIFRHHAFLVLSGKTELGDRYFVCCEDKGACRFPSFMLNTLQVDLRRLMIDSFQLYLTEEQFVVHDFLTFRACLLNERAHILSKIYFIDISPVVNEKVFEMRKNTKGIKILPLKGNLAHIPTSKTENFIYMLMQKLSCDITSALILSYYWFAKSIDVFDLECFNVLNKFFQDWYIKQCALTDAARKGNIAKLQTLHQHLGTKLDFATPIMTLRSGIEVPMEEFPLEAAFNYKKYESALFLLRQGAPIKQWFLENSLMEIVEKGQLEIFKIICDRNYKYCNEMMNDIFAVVVKNNQIKMAKYILQNKRKKLTNLDEYLCLAAEHLSIDIGRLLFPYTTDPAKYRAYTILKMKYLCPNNRAEKIQEEINKKRWELKEFTKLLLSYAEEDEPSPKENVRKTFML